MPGTCSTPQACRCSAADRVHPHVLHRAPQQQARESARRVALHMSSIVTPGGLHITTRYSASSGMVVAGILEFAVAARQPVAGGARLHLRLRCGAHPGRVRADPSPGGRVLDRRGPQEHRRRHPRTHLHHPAADRAAAAQHQPGGDYITISRWLAFVLILSGGGVRRRVLPQGKLFVGTVGILSCRGRLHRRAAPGQTELALGAARVRPAVPRRWSGARAPRRGLPPVVGAAQTPLVGPHRRQAAPLAAAPGRPPRPKPSDAGRARPSPAGKRESHV